MAEEVEAVDGELAAGDGPTEIVLPEGMTLDALLEPVVAAPAAPPAAPAPAATAGVAPAEPAPARAEPLSQAAKIERRRRKEWRDKWERTQQDNERLRGELRDARAQTGMSAEDARWLEDVRSKAAAANDMSAVADVLVGEVRRQVAVNAATIRAEFRRQRIADQEASFKEIHPDYEETLKKAGIFDAIRMDQAGRYADPAIALAVYRSDNPCKAAYELALGKQEAERGDEDEESTVTRGAAEADAPAPKVAEVVAAERRGAAAVIDKVTQTGERVRGLRAVPAAGTTPQRVSLKQLDELSEKNPDAYESLMAKNPDLLRYHLGG